MKRQGYKFAVDWIANNDNPGDKDDAMELAGYATVALVADMFGKNALNVAQDVVKRRGQLAEAS